MDAERARAIVKKLAHVEETVQWGENLVFWVGDKAIGGKMFALVDMDTGGGPVMSFSAGPERYAELLENEGVVPAPYMARIHWVALQHWDAIEARALTSLLANAHALTYAKLTQRTKGVLALPAGERRQLVEAGRKLIDESRSKVTAAKAAEIARKESLAELKRAAKEAAKPAKKKGSKAVRVSPR